MFCILVFKSYRYINSYTKYDFINDHRCEITKNGHGKKINEIYKHNIS